MMALLSLPAVIDYFRNISAVTISKINLKNPIIIAAILFCGWVFISCFWSPNPVKSLTLYLRISILIAVFLAALKYYKSFTPTITKKIIKSLTFGICIALIFFLIEKSVDGKIISFLTSEPANIAFATNAGICFLSLTIWPVIYYWRQQKQKSLALFLWCFTALIVFLSRSETAKLAFIANSFLFPLAIYSIRYTKIILVICFIASFLAMPIFSYFISPQKTAENYPFIMSTAIHRLCIWQDVAKLSAAEPLGYGFDSSRYFTDKRGLCFTPNEKANNPSYYDVYYQIYLHPHNNIMQITLEIGFVGLFLLLSLLTLFSSNLHKFKNPAILSLVTLGYFLIGLTGYGIWQNWLIASLLINLLLVRLQKQ